MIRPLRDMQTRRKFDRGRQRKPVRSLLGSGKLSLRKASRQSQRMQARRTGLRGL